MAEKKRNKASSNVSEGGVVAGTAVNMPEDETRENKPNLRATSQANESPGFVFFEEPVYGNVMEVDQEATKRAHDALKNRGEQ